MNILVIDTGTSSMRGVVFHEKGNIIYSKTIELYMENDNAIYEMDATAFVSALTSICLACSQAVSMQGTTIDAISLTSQRSSVLAVNENGSPLSKIIMWHDKRAVSICDEFISLYGESKIYDLSGAHLTPVMSAPKMVWLMRNRPEIYNAAYKLIGIHDLLLYTLTEHFCTDDALASRTCLLDIHQKCWSDTLINMFGIDKNKLCDILPPGSIVGNIVPSFCFKTGLNAIPVITCGGDQQCSVLGQGITQPGCMGITIGTGAYVTLLSNTPLLDSEHRTNISTAVTGNQWISEANSMSSGLIYRWFRNAFYSDEGDYSAIDDEIRKNTQLGANGIIALPYFSGKGCPDWNSSACGVFYNIGLTTSRADCARALLEGIAAEIFDCYITLSALTAPVQKVIICGGLSGFSVFAQMLSDILDVTVYTLKSKETTSLGAFAVSMHCLDKTRAIHDIIHALQSNISVIEPNKLHGAAYRKLNEARHILYQTLPYQNINRITQDAYSLLRKEQNEK